MNAAGRIGLYGAGLVVVLVASTVVAGAVAPDGAASRWSGGEAHSGAHPVARTGPQAGAGDDGHGEHAASAGAPSPHGLALEQDGYLLGEIGAPRAAGETGELAFRITDARGEPLTDYGVSHGKELHLIVVRADGTHFRHVHPERDADGVWSLPWTWQAAGTYRVYADFSPTAPDALGETSAVTLTRTVQVAGDYAPVASTPSATASVDGFDVTLHGELRAGAATELTAEITRDGEPVTTLEPYLGAFGHLVALREGDLAYLHVHPEGAEPRGDERSGPEVTFVTEAPTEGRYLLYLDFQVDGQVRTAAFTVDTAGSVDTAGTAGEQPDDETAVGHDTGDHDH
jgi:hypothetical protein